MTPPRRFIAPLASALISFAVSTGLFGSSASLEAAARALRDGDAARAATLYETLAQQGESLEAELGLVRANIAIHGVTAASPQASWLATSFQSLPLDRHRIVGSGNGVVIDGGKTVLTYAPVVYPQAPPTFSCAMV